MTFIASVIAKNGVALVADSLVTMVMPIMEITDFARYIRSKTSVDGKVSQLNVNELEHLFHRRPTHTKDYEEKLFKYDKYTGITTAGKAVIDGKRTGEVIELISKKLHGRGYWRKSIDTRVNDFCRELETIARSHIAKKKSIGSTTFILTYFEKKDSTTHIFRVNIKTAEESDLQNTDFRLVISSKCYDIENVVCDGQNGISERILWGGIDVVLEKSRELIAQIEKDQGLKLPKEYKEGLIDSIVTKFQKNLKIEKLSGLSLQQAVDLAYLLIKIEIDFQKYTEDLPTVGGVIKIAVIDKEGFRFIAGKDIIDPREHL